MRCYTRDYEDLLVNEIGHYEGNRPIAGAGPIVFDIDADGPWTLELEAIGAADTSLFSGTGDATSDIFVDPGSRAWEIVHTGESNFIVTLWTQEGSQLIQNEIGPVSGSRIIRIPEGIWF